MPDEREIGSIDIRLIRQALDVNAANLALGHEVFFAAGAQFVRNRAYPAIRDANHVTDVSASTPVEIDRLMARVDEEFEGAHRMFHVDFRTPPSFEARLRFDGYQRSETLVLVHQCVADARSRGAGPVVIATDPADTPKHMYAAMGWEPVAVKREYLRVMTEGA